jgi:hypothetical protein
VTVEGDVNGKADFQIDVHGTSDLTSLLKADFVL